MNKRKTRRDDYLVDRHIQQNVYVHCTVYCAHIDEKPAY